MSSNHGDNREETGESSTHSNGGNSEELEIPQRFVFLRICLVSCDLNKTFEGETQGLCSFQWSYLLDFYEWHLNVESHRILTLILSFFIVSHKNLIKTYLF